MMTRSKKQKYFLTEQSNLNKSFLRARMVEPYHGTNLKKFPDALVDFSKLIELRPNIPESYINRGNVFLSKGDFAEALQDFDTALALNPKLASAFNGRGLANHKLGNNNLALEDFNASILIKNDFTGAVFNRGNVLRDIGRLDEALEDYKRVLQLAKFYLLLTTGEQSKRYVEIILGRSKILMQQFIWIRDFS